MADDMAVSSSGEHLDVSMISAGGNELSLVNGDAEGESVLEKQLEMFVATVLSVTIGCLSLDWGSSMFMVLSMINVGALDSSRGPVPLCMKPK